MSTILRAANNKGSFYGDASYRTAHLRKQAICAGQSQKGGTCSVAMNPENQVKKPLLSEHHLTKGFTNGVSEFIHIKNKDGIF